MKIFLDKTASLTQAVKEVIEQASTESPYSGKYNTLASQGSYLCRRCGLSLFRADSQFTSGCGWPSFDAEIDNNVLKLKDQDGVRIEIRCRRCEAHLGHVFEGEHFTFKNKRYCVNSLSLDFVLDNDIKDSEEIIVAGGCFWGVEYYLCDEPGVIKTEVGYTGGNMLNPHYDAVCAGNTGHYEALRILFDPAKTACEAIIKRFFEIHDPTQKNGQGADIGQQYQSAIFYYTEDQYKIAKRLIGFLQDKGYEICTQVLPVQTFWVAENYHQNYYEKHHKTPYCHKRVARFNH